jgi:hypothetical protein
MSREINWEEPLSDEDRVYLEHRLDAPAGFGGMNIAQAIEANDAKHGRAEKAQALSREERIAELRTIIADSQNEMERLVSEGNLEANPNLGKQGDPAVGLVVDNTGVDGERPEGSPEPKETYSNEKYWTKARLSEEIEARNGDRVAAGLDALSTSGTRSEMVERLQKDDKELEEA